MMNARDLDSARATGRRNGQDDEAKDNGNAVDEVSESAWAREPHHVTRLSQENNVTALLFRDCVVFLRTRNEVIDRTKKWY
jgi:hypothetical protein